MAKRDSEPLKQTAPYKIRSFNSCFIFNEKSSSAGRIIQNAHKKSEDVFLLLIASKTYLLRIKLLLFSKQMGTDGHCDNPIENRAFFFRVY